MSFRKIIRTLEAMYNSEPNIFKIETNHIVPEKGRILISEPFLRDHMFGRSVILLIEHTLDGSMGLILNKRLPLFLNSLIEDVEFGENIPLYQGGPISMDTLFYLHTLEGIPHSLQISPNIYLNGDFNSIKQYLSQGGSASGHIRFFLGYSGWEYQQLTQEVAENTWLISKESASMLMAETTSEQMWKFSLGKLGDKYEIWSHFPQIPALN